MVRCNNVALHPNCRLPRVPAASRGMFHVEQRRSRGPEFGWRTVTPWGAKNAWRAHPRTHFPKF